jgi:hypothetical protein
MIGRSGWDWEARPKRKKDGDKSERQNGERWREEYRSRRR